MNFLIKSSIIDMAYNLKLEIFRVSLKKKGTSNDQLLNYSEFFKEAFPGLSKEKSYKEFIQRYINSYDQEFKLNKDETKGISASTKNKFVPRFRSNLIDGEVFGGSTGIAHTIFEQDNSRTSKGTTSDGDVLSNKYYFKLWTPQDHDTGVLMVQSYSNLTITDLIKKHLSDFFKKYNFSLIISGFVPKSLIKEYKDNSNVYKVAFVKETLSRDKRELLNPLFTEYDNLKIRIEVSGFKKPISEFWDKLRGVDKIINSNLLDFDIKENDDYKTIAYYKDDNGYRSNTSIKKPLEISPTIFLDDRLKQPKSDFYSFNKIKNHTDHILEEIKKEIRYKE